MQDKRLVNRLENYWRLICRGRNMPDIAQLNTSTIDDMWQQCMQLEVVKTQGEPQFRYNFVGDRLVDVFGRDLTGMTLDPKATYYPYNIIVSKLGTILESGEFMRDENQFVGKNNKIIKYRTCFMPFGNETRGVTHVVVGFSAREFEL